jgi:hypothetical protein
LLEEFRTFDAVGGSIIFLRDWRVSGCRRLVDSFQFWGKIGFESFIEYFCL